jgi:hypothetical protein
MDNQQAWRSGRFGEIFGAWDLRLTRGGIYPEYYVVQRPGNAGRLESWESRSEEEKNLLMKAFVCNPLLSETTYLPVEDRWGSIVRDMPLVEHYYPAYYYSMLYILTHGMTQGDKDVIESRGLWYYILRHITETHAQVHARKHLPRGRLPPATMSAEDFNAKYYPSWDWETVNRRIVLDILDMHFPHWYYTYAKPRIEDTEDSFGKFFMALEILLDYVTHLVNDNLAALMRSFNQNRELNNTTQHAIDVLLSHSLIQYGQMRSRFFENEWNMCRYHIDHSDDDV